MRNILIIIVVPIMIFIASGNGQTVIIVYSHNTNGILENCNCPERSYGALEKRAAVIDSIRKKEKNIILVDTGDILDIRDNRLLHEYIVRSYQYMHYDYWVPGDQDFVEGVDFFKGTMRSIGGLMLATNIDYQNKNIGKSYDIRQFGQVSIAFSGTISEDVHKYLGPQTGKEFRFIDQQQGLRKVIKEINEEANYIILLSHSGIDRDRKIAVEFPDIDLIIGGHSQTLLSEPQKIGSTYITQIGESGYRLGVAKLTFENKKLLSIENSIILLKKNMRNDPHMMVLIKEYHEKRLSGLKMPKIE